MFLAICPGSSKNVGADFNVAWPTAEIAVMGAGAAVPLIYRREIGAVADGDARADLSRRLIEKYSAENLTPYAAADRGYIDKVIRPRETRRVVAEAFRILAAKRLGIPLRKHNNMPI